jgi:pyruvate dehydrogenase E1 component alpha subunit
MGTSVSRTSNVTELYKSGLSYDIPSEPVDAMNVVKVHRAISKAAKRARSGEGPSLLEFRTYRFKGHSMSDPAKYRTKEELEHYKDKDPIEQVKNMILKKKILTKEQINDIDLGIKDQVKKSVEFSEKSPYPKKEDVFSDVYVQTNYPFLKE